MMTAGPMAAGALSAEIRSHCIRHGVEMPPLPSREPTRGYITSLDKD